MNGHAAAHTKMNGSPGSHRTTSIVGGELSMQPRYPHIKDLLAKSNTITRELEASIPVGAYFLTLLLLLCYLECTSNGKRAPQVRTLLGRAQQSVNQASTDVSFKRPDRGYVEYLVSSEILLNLIPHHKDYPALYSDRRNGEWGRIYKSLIKVST